MTRRFTIAAAQYRVDPIADIDALEAHLDGWLGEAAGAGARLAIFPEYGAMELSAANLSTAGDIHAAIRTVSDLLPQIDALHAALAQRYGLHILAASAPRLGPDGWRNVARLFAPNGKHGEQEKIVMTRFEREIWGIGGGSAIRLFDTDLGRIGIAICYDSEFPLIARAQAEAGMDVLLVPSATDSLHGYWRVRLGAQARAMENQCWVVHSPTVGNSEWQPSLDISRGAAGIYGPPDKGVPDNAIVALGEMDENAWVFGTVDLDLTERLRADGGVLNYRHWGEQLGGAPLPSLPPVERVDLRS
jgi:predicted amidohydrolase